MRSRISKLAMFMLGLCMTVSMFSVNVSAVSDDCTDECANIVEPYDYDDAQDYIDDGDSSTYPTCSKEGYIFAGWYTNDKCGEDSYWGQEEPGDTVYALFVPSHILSVKAQISANLLDGDTGNDGSASIRFVTTVDTLYYRQAGFTVSYEKGGSTVEKTSASNVVYKKLYAIASAGRDAEDDEQEFTGDDVLEYTPDGSFCNLSTYFKACTIKNVGSDYYTTPFTVTSFWKTMDGSIVTGETVIKSINDYFLANEVYVSSQMDTAADTVENGSAKKPFKTLEYALGMVANGGTIHIVDSYTASSDFEWKDHDKTVTITGGSLDFTALPIVTIEEATEETEAETAVMLHIHDNVTFKDTSITFVDGQHIYAWGNRVVIDSSVTWGNSSAYVLIYGGGYRTALTSDTNLVLGAGNYKRVFGGGNYGSVKGDVDVTLSGNVNTGINYKNHTLTYAAFGGGENSCAVTGDINFIIADNTVLFDYIYGGGLSSKVTGDITVDYNGYAMSVFAGGRGGSVTGNTKLVMNGGWVEQLFGGCQAASMTGNTDVQVLGGTVDRRVYGGCYNNATETIESYVEKEISLTWKTTYKVKGYTSVTIADEANLEFDYTKTYTYELAFISYDFTTELDNNLIAFSRYETALDGETGVMIFNDDLHSTYSNLIGTEYGKLTVTSGEPQDYYNYLVIANEGGAVYSEGDSIRIVPDTNNGMKATVRLESADGEIIHYAESESVCELQPKLSETDTQIIYVVFDEETPSNVNVNNYEAKVNGGYYETLEEAVDAAEILATEDTIVWATLLKDAEVESTMAIDDSANVGIDGAGYTINRADSLVNGSIFTVSKGNTLTVKNAVLDGRITSNLSVTDLDSLTGSTESLIYNAGTVNLNGITTQYAVKTEMHGAVLQSAGSTDVVTIEDSIFKYNKSAGQGGAIRMGGNTDGLEVKNTTFEYNECYTLYSTDDEGTVTVSARGQGGALAIHADTANIENCKFVGNTAEGHATKKDGNGGAVYCGSSSVVTITGTDENALFSGNGVTYGYGGAVSLNNGKVIITGYTFTSNTSSSHGGALFATTSTSKIKSISCYFEGNTAGGSGGVAYAGSSSTLIFDVDDSYTVEAIAKSNTAETSGGAIGQNDGSYVKVTGYSFESNKAAEHGGAIYNIEESSLAITNASFVSNEAEATGGAIRNSGMLTLIGNGSENSVFDGNQTTGSSKMGGAIYNDGTMKAEMYTFKNNVATSSGGAVASYSTDSKFVDCQFLSNSATNGGAVYSGGSSYGVSFTVSEEPRLEALFRGNSSTSSYGGAIAVPNGALEIDGYTFEANTAETHGGAVYIAGEITTGNRTVENATFVQNEATVNGGAIMLAGSSGADVAVENCTFGGTLEDGTSLGNVANRNGGAIYCGGASVLDIMGNEDATISIFEGNKSYADGSIVTSHYGGGAICVAYGSVTISGYTFKDNSATYVGGAIAGGCCSKLTENTVTNEDETTTTTYTPTYRAGNVSATNCDFEGNTATVGGAINCYASTLVATSCDFTSNSATPSSADALNGLGGGAVNVVANSTATFNGTGTFTSNTATDYFGGAIYTTDANVSISGYTFDGNSAEKGGALFIDDVFETYVEEEATTDTIIVADTKFANNTATGNGGAIELEGRTLKLENKGEVNINSLFYNNNANYGGAIYGTSDGTILANGYTFDDNSATKNGGALCNYTIESEFTDCQFTNNETTGGNGGAVYSGGDNLIYFTETESPVIEAKFENNTASGYGGAIGMGSGKVYVTGYVFTSNKATTGGAIRQVQADVEKALVEINGSQFSSNIATEEGGAIYNVGPMSIENATFTSNQSSGASGGAIYNDEATTSIVSSEFESNTSGTYGGAIHNLGSTSAMTVVNTKFKSNTSTAQGGAIANTSTGKLYLYAVSSEHGVTETTKAIFETNTANNETSGYGGGAIYNNAGVFTINGYTFTDNTASADGGAICTRSAATIENTTFSKNTSTLTGGAIYVSSGKVVSLTDTAFDGNSSSSTGGAIHNAGKLTLAVGSNSKNAYFMNNEASNNGGAIYVVGSGATISATGYTFDKNTSSKMGGAVGLGNVSKSTSNVGVQATFDDCTFTRNSAGSAGGAIANNQNAVVGTVGNTQIKDCTFGSADDSTMGNVATTKGGAVFLNTTSQATISGSKFYYNMDANGGGAIYNQLKSLKLTVGTCTFKGNTPNDIHHDTTQSSINMFVDNGGNTGDSEDGSYSSNY